MRLLRNRLVHEYVDDMALLCQPLLLAKAQAESLHESYLKLRGS